MKDIIPAKKESPILGLSGMGGGVGCNLVAGVGLPKIYADDVFKIDRWKGDGNIRAINNGVDLSGEGGMVWIKGTDLGSDWVVGSTGLSDDQCLCLNTQGAVQTAATKFRTLNSNGFTVGGDNEVNNSAFEYISFSFRKQEKFMDIVEYTGNATARAIPHNLGCVPGMIIIKSKDQSREWIVYHRGVGNDASMKLNTHDAKNTSTSWWNNTTPTDTHFTVGNMGDVNSSGANFIAYLFSHNEAAHGEEGDLPLVACGSYTGTGSDIDINFGFEPQFWIVKNTQENQPWVVSNSTYAFGYFNATGGHPTDAETINTDANTAMSTTNARIYQTPNGINIRSESQDFLNDSGKDYIYFAVRQAVGLVAKEVDAGTDVFHTTTSNGQDCPPGSFNTGFEADFFLTRPRGSSSDWYAATRKSGTRRWLPNSTSGNNTADSNYVWDSSTGAGNGFSGSDSFWAWKRSRGFDVQWNGSLGAGTYGHSLGQVPEMIWVGNLSQNDWHGVGHHKLRTADPWNYVAYMDTTSTGNAGSGYWNNTAPTTTQYTLGSNTAMSSGGIMVCLWCSVPGISKIDDYNGDGSSSNAVNCGFQPRYVMIKRVDDGSDWKVWDHDRGTNMLRLNTSNAQVNDNLVSFTSTGFTLISPDGTVNASGGRYIYHAQA